jgi:hypothetical protein
MMMMRMSKAKQGPAYLQGWRVQWIFLFLVVPCPVLLRERPTVARTTPEEIARMCEPLPGLKEKVKAFMDELEKRKPDAPNEEA